MKSIENPDDEVRKPHEETREMQEPDALDRSIPLTTHLAFLRFMQAAAAEKPDEGEDVQDEP